MRGVGGKDIEGGHSAVEGGGGEGGGGLLAVGHRGDPVSEADSTLRKRMGRGGKGREGKEREGGRGTALDDKSVLGGVGSV